MWRSQFNSLAKYQGLLTLRGSSSIAVTKPESFICSRCYAVSILLVNLRFFSHIHYNIISKQNDLIQQSHIYVINQWICTKHDAKGFRRCIFCVSANVKFLDLNFNIHTRLHGVRMTQTDCMAVIEPKYKMVQK